MAENLTVRENQTDIELINDVGCAHPTPKSLFTFTTGLQNDRMHQPSWFFSNQNG